MTRAVFSWSGGKDSALAYQELSDGAEVLELLTTVSENDRTSMHGVRKRLIKRQAREMGVPVRFVEVSQDAGNEEYEEKMRGVLSEYVDEGIDTLVFADIYLEDVRRYREDNLSAVDLEGMWPLWGRDTTELIRDFFDLGFRATTVCVDSRLGRERVGRELTREFVDCLPSDVDPCGENGEYHTFVWDAPYYDSTVDVEVGEVVERVLGDETYYYCDLLAAPGPEGT